jgi:malonate-semialdehyde dehydrogenase (acetylating)/methylmalonate-semialdehyde dehydrogenase
VATKENVTIIQNYVGGKWAEPSNKGYLEVENPSSTEIIGRVALSTAEEVDRAVTAAAQAYKSWSLAAASRRVQPLYQLAAMMRENEEKIARVLVAEMGKSLPDAQAEMKRSIENVETACGMPVLQQGDKLIGCAAGIDGEVIRLPMGVFGIIAPFNFPAMVPFWFIPYAIATGNTCVCKSSEQVPMTMQLITEYIDQTDLPPGVFNLVNGDKDVSVALAEHPLIQGISLVGRSSTCQIVAANCARNGKRCQALGSAKNHLVAMPDAQVDQVIRNMTTSCYGCAGQRCMASSAIVAVGDDMYRQISERFVEDSQNVIMGDPLDPRYLNEPMLMGPLISQVAKDFVLQMIEAGIQEGATLALDGRNVCVDGGEGYFVGPTVFTDVKPGMEIHRTEIFGPVVVILKADTLDEAIEIINNHQYSNGASIYTQSGYSARKFKLEAECGMIGVNVGIPAPVASLPFGGMKNSFHADIKAQGRAVIDFFTHNKVITERFWDETC